VTVIDKKAEAILDFFKQETTHPVSLGEIARRFGFKKGERRDLRRHLRSLINTGVIYKTRHGLYGLSERMNLITGFFEAHRDGYGFVLPDKPQEADIFIPPGRTLGAMSGDHVVARIESERRREGSVIRILKREQKRVVGRLIQEKNLFFVRPRNKKIPFDIFISPRNKADAKRGDRVIVEIISYPTHVRPAEGRVIRRLPAGEEPHIEIEAIIDEYSLSTRFPVPVNEEIEQITDKVSARNRVDLRKKLTVTIDGETAKDFDDAISIEKTSDGYTLFVHIADVSHYVPWDSAIDLEAMRRGTSIYFPGKTIPMLPRRLSDDLCSLLPGKDRYTFTVELRFDRRGELTGRDFYLSVINSNERMTYTSVKKILLDIDPYERRRYEYLLEKINVMRELCEILRDRRMKRGSLDFDLPEPEVLLDIQGRPEGIIRAERNISHMIIEEFMIAANEAVASYLYERGIPSIFRVHEKPDPSKLKELMPLFNALGLRVNRTGAHMFQSVLEQVRGMPSETLLNTLLLRSLKQARYSTENIGHFGLASVCYTHFTSPIRRYPDLVVHRILKEAITHKGISKKRRTYLEETLPDIAINSSRRERLADEAEREVVNAMRVWFMIDKVGNEYEGVISSVSPYGMRVRFKDFFVEGSLRLSSMLDDYYRFDERTYRLTGRRTRRSFTLGTEVRARVERVDMEEREIILSLV